MVCNILRKTKNWEAPYDSAPVYHETGICASDCYAASKVEIQQCPFQSK